MRCLPPCSLWQQARAQDLRGLRRDWNLRYTVLEFVLDRWCLDLVWWWPVVGHRGPDCDWRTSHSRTVIAAGRI